MIAEIECVVFRSNFNELLEDQRLLEVQKFPISEVQTQMKLLVFGILHYRRKECVFNNTLARGIKVSSKYLRKYIYFFKFSFQSKHQV